MIKRLMEMLRQDYLTIRVNRTLLLVVLAMLGLKYFYRFAYSRGANDGIQYMLQKLNAPDDPETSNS